MRINPIQFIPKTVTIINRLKKSDSITGLELWQKTTLTNCAWIMEEHSAQNGNTTNLGRSIAVHIPDNGNGQYLPYSEWKQDGKQTGNWTVSTDDWVVLGEVTENITSANITTVMNGYKPNACQIKTFEDLTMKDGYTSTGGFLSMYESMYYVGGV